MARVFVAGAALFISVATRAEPPAGAFSSGLGNAKVGEWATYRLHSSHRGGYLRFSVVEEAKDGLGREACWVEMELGADPELAAPLFRLAMLVARSPGAVEPISRMVVAVGLEPPQEASREVLGHLLGERAAEDPGGLTQGGRVRRGEAQLRMTKLGSLKSFPIDTIRRGQVVRRTWFSPEVPVLHLVAIELFGLDDRMEIESFGHASRRRMALPSPQVRKIRLERYDDKP